MTKDAFRRCILDALAEGYSYDAFRTALRTKLRALEAEEATIIPDFMRACVALARGIESGDVCEAQQSAMLRHYRRQSCFGLIWMLPGFPEADAAERAAGAEIILEALRSKHPDL